MIYYNVTIIIDPEVETAWIDWMKNVHIPEVLATGCFLSHNFCRLLSVEPEQGLTYSIQYKCKDMETYEHYKSKYAAGLQAEHQERFRDRFIGFRSLMEDV